MNKQKDILMLCQYFYPEYISSATLPYDTAVALSDAGYKVGVICGYPKEYNKSKQAIPKREFINNIYIKRLKYIQLSRNSFLGRIINYFSYTLSVFLNFFKLRNYRVIIVYSNPPILPLITAIAKKMFGTKFIFVCYDIYPEIAEKTNVINKGSGISKLMRFINKIVFKNIDNVVALSNEMKEYLSINRQGLKKSDIKVIPNWYEDSKKEHNSLNSSGKFHEFEDKFIVSYFGNMGTAQDLETLLDTIVKLKSQNHIHFLFAGHGNKLETLKNIIEENQLENVSVYNFLHGADFQKALHISDVFIVSLADGITGLAVPSKTYSYMMEGKPILAIIGKESDIAKDLHEYNAGYAIEVGEVDKLLQYINQMSKNIKQCEIMGRNCREIYLKKYTTSICTNKYVEMVDEILEGNNV